MSSWPLTHPLVGKARTNKPTRCMPGSWPHTDWQGHVTMWVDRNTSLIYRHSLMWDRKWMPAVWGTSDVIRKISRYIKHPLTQGWPSCLISHFFANLMPNFANLYLKLREAHAQFCRSGILLLATSLFSTRFWTPLCQCYRRKMYVIFNWNQINHCNIHQITTANSTQPYHNIKEPAYWLLKQIKFDF